MMDGKPVKVRFAPSPTGPFSLGNARTALFNWLFARRHNGEFLIRVEDTDPERSKPEFEKEILSGLKWLGMNWDGEIIKQSARQDVYEKNIKILLEKKQAYYCFCTEEELEAQRQNQLSHGMPPKYIGRCRGIPAEEAEARVAAGEKAVIRFKVPEKTVVFADLIRGKVEFNAALIGDIIIARDLKRPFYNFAAAVDDAEMEITHVIRGEDHLSNTPKQILIQSSLDFKSPIYAHLPLILEPGGKKLSKRSNPKSISDYKNEGYLPEAILNFIILLGWHPERDREVVIPEEMRKEFGLERVQKSGAVFNEKKLDWLNSHYIKNLSPQTLRERLKPFISSEWNDDPGFLDKAIGLEKERMKKLTEFRELASFLFKAEDYDSKLVVWKDSLPAETLENLKESVKILNEVPEDDFNYSELTNKISGLADKKGKGNVFWPIRAALSGRAASPGPVEIMEVLGKNESISRLEKAVEKLENEI